MDIPKISIPVEHRNLIYAVLDGKELQWCNTALVPAQWLTFPTPREAIHALVSFPARIYRIKPDTKVLWCGVRGTWVTASSPERKGVESPSNIAVLRVEIDDDTQQVIGVTPEKP